MTLIVCAWCGEDRECPDERGLPWYGVCYDCAKKSVVRRRLYTDAMSKLIRRGATHERREDNRGDPKDGWWLDDCYLAPYTMPMLALSAIDG